jgi:hypothetical protein
MIFVGEMTEDLCAGIMLAMSKAAAGRSGAISQTPKGGDATAGISANNSCNISKECTAPINVPARASRPAPGITNKTMR